jgi:hypothetical protein
MVIGSLINQSSYEEASTLHGISPDRQGLLSSPPVFENRALGRAEKLFRDSIGW